MRLAEAETTVALVGNPNTGKTTLFNALTGLSHRVGNYPGVTVEHKQGRFELGRRSVRLVDLPGTYSLAARSRDEMVAVDALLGHGLVDEAPDAIIAIIDATNLPRNLYLVSQLLELNRPLVLALNMSDRARAQGIEIDHAGLGAYLGVPVVPIAADRNEGLETLQEALEKAISRGAPRPGGRADLPASLLEGVDKVHRRLEEASGKLGWTPCRAEALRCLVDVGGEFERRFGERLGDAFRHAVTAAREEMPGSRTPASAEAHARYAWIDDLVRRFVRRPKPDKTPLTRRIDALLTHRLWGSGALLLILAGV
ncbi:MAG: FeoB small GTPase domain-containing protein, partial [Acidobacteriota bacterium]|nr:FeoB small GTPase domain-containing protein [Acidobacteriota bacterium]